MLLPQKVRPEPAPTRTPLRRTHHEPRRRDEQARAHQAPGDALRLPNPKKDAEPSEQHRERKRKNTEEIARAAKFANRACRATSTAAASTPLPSAPPSTSPTWIRSTVQFSSIKEGDVRYTNKRFGICHKRKNEAEGDRVMARSRLDSKGPEESGLLHTGSTRGPKVYGWYSFVLKGLGVFP